MKTFNLDKMNNSLQTGKNQWYHFEIKQQNSFKSFFCYSLSTQRHRLKKVNKEREYEYSNPQTNCPSKMLEFQLKYWSKSGFQLKLDTRIVRITCSVLH